MPQACNNVTQRFELVRICADPYCSIQLLFVRSRAWLRDIADCRFPGRPLLFSQSAAFCSQQLSSRQDRPLRLLHPGCLLFPSCLLFLSKRCFEVIYCPPALRRLLFCEHRSFVRRTALRDREPVVGYKSMAVSPFTLPSHTSNSNTTTFTAHRFTTPNHYNGLCYHRRRHPHLRLG